MSHLKDAPVYEGHKKVRALQINGIKNNTLYVHGAFAPIVVGKSWILKHEPEVDGYYVVYEDGYTSYSPQEAFEDGYTLAGQ